MIQKVARRPTLDAQRAIVDRDLLIAAYHAGVRRNAHPALQGAVGAVRRNCDRIGSPRFDRLRRHTRHFAMVVPLRVTNAPRMAEMAINTGARPPAPATADQPRLRAAGPAFDKIV